MISINQGRFYTYFSPIIEPSPDFTDGLRTEKTVGSTVHKYEYTGSTLFYENRGGMQLHYRYDVNGNLASITRIKADGAKFTLYAVCNSRGDVEELRTLAGALYARYVYDSWGNTLHIYNASGVEITSTANLAVQNPIRYRGYYFDTETGLYYLQSRYYDPVTCRFLNADAYISTGTGVLGCNMFAYCNNNPILYTDSFGNRPFVGISTEHESAEEKFLSFATMNNTSVKSISTEFSGTMYIIDANTRDNTKSASTKALINNSGNGYWVVTDNRNNGYVEIINSCKTFNIAKQADILNTFSKYAHNNPVSPSIWYRTISSMYIEWTWHNAAYFFGVMQKNSASACFDIYLFCNTDIAILQIYGEGKKRGWW